MDILENMEEWIFSWIDYQLDIQSAVMNKTFYTIELPWCSNILNKFKENKKTCYGVELPWSCQDTSESMRENWWLK